MWSERSKLDTLVQFGPDCARQDCSEWEKSLNETKNYAAKLTAAQNVLARRLFISVAVAGILIGLSLIGGVAGYHFFEQMPWIDAFVNASMILSGMGPVKELQTSGGKFFAGCYALYSGLVLILVTGFILAPIVNFVLHRFHLDAKNRG
jgi:hypothetical protein